MTRLHGERTTETLLSTEFVERDAAISPDDRWIAYESDASGRYEVYVRPFPDVDAGLWQVSTSGGTDPVWAHDGRELFFLQGAQLMTTAVATQGAFERGAPEVMFETDSYYYFPAGRNYDVAPDERFLMIKDRAEPGHETLKINVVLNWRRELRERVPAN